jgi:hypothetical protein
MFLVAGAVAAVVIAIAAAIQFSGGEAVPAAPGTMFVTALPNDAEILIDGAVIARMSPFTARGLQQGRHDLLIQRDGYLPFQEQIVLKPGENLSRIVTLEEKNKVYGVLSVESDPPGATITVDGRVLASVTPLRLDKLLADVDHTIIAERAGLKPVTKSVRVKDGAADTVKLVFKPAKADLSVVTTPSGARIFINNEPRGVSPVKIEGLDTAKEFTVRAEKPGFDNSETVVTFDMEKEKPVSLELVSQGSARKQLRVAEPPRRERTVASTRPQQEKQARPETPAPKRREAVAAPAPGKGFLSLNSIPWSHVSIDGRPTGKTTPLPKYPVPPGEHTVTLRTEDGRERTLKVEIKPGETTLLKERFN